nr:hypothetical protein CFP56_32353 [Quercus suber]
MRYHVRNTPGGGWQYEETPLRSVQSTMNLLARITIAKIDNEDRLIRILRNLPVIQNDPDWRCRTWVASALDAMARDGKAVGTSELDWKNIETFAREYVSRKHAGGRYGSGIDMLAAKPTYDMMTHQETIP